MRAFAEHPRQHGCRVPPRAQRTTCSSPGAQLVPAALGAPRRSRAPALLQSAHSETVAAGETIPVRQRRQVCVSRREPARAWLLRASRGHAHAVTALRCDRQRHRLRARDRNRGPLPAAVEATTACPMSDHEFRGRSGGERDRGKMRGFRAPGERQPLRRQARPDIKAGPDSGRSLAGQSARPTSGTPA
jgi:hypothetical protein